MKKIQNYIDGSSFSISKEELSVEDPSTGEEIAKVVLSSKEDFEKVIESSNKSQLEWSNVTPLKRSRILSNYKELINKNLEELEDLLCKSCKRPLIDPEMFPGTESEPYWTGEQNGLSTRHYFSVNFFNGWVYGRFLPTRPLAVRLVRDRH